MIITIIFMITYTIFMICILYDLYVYMYDICGLSLINLIYIINVAPSKIHDYFDIIYLISVAHSPILLVIFKGSILAYTI